MIQIISERLKKELSVRKWSLSYFAELCDLPIETVKNIYYGKTADPKVSTVAKIAHALDISMNCLIGQCEHTDDEKELLINYRACGNHGKNLMLIVSRYEATIAKSERESTGKHTIPCLVPSGDIHYGINYDMSETIYIDTVLDEADVGIKMISNDLIPIYCKDDIILIENRFPHNGEYGVFYKGERAYIRKFIEQNDHYILKCLHPFGEDFIFKRLDSINYIGTCVGVVRE